MGSNLRIVYEEDGFPRELTSPAEWKQAVGEGSLAPHALVTVSRAGERSVVVRASEVPELEAFFAPDRSVPQADAAVATASTVSEGLGAVVSSSSTSPDPLPDAPVPSAPPPRAAPLDLTRADEQPAVFDLTRADEDLTDTGAAWNQPAHRSRAGDGYGKILAAVAAVLLLLVIVAGTLSGPGSGTDTTVDDAPVTAGFVSNEAVPAEAGEAVAEGATVEWTDNGSPRTYATEGLQLIMSTEQDGEGAKVPVLTVRSADLGDSKVVGVAGGETASAKFIVLRPSRADRFPSVLLMTYSMGAHCCTSLRLLTPRNNAWTLADLGQWDGEPLSAAPTDVDGDGRLDFVMRDNAFLYAFASYADSWTPSLVYNVVDGRFVDRTAAARYRSIHLADMVQAKAECAKRSNGACAAYVASAARIGQEAAALQFASANFDQATTQGWLPARCQQQLVDGACPSGAEIQPSGFVQALEWFLQDRGYVRGPITPIAEPDAPPEPETPDPSLELELNSSGNEAAPDAG
jgi:hypothetical protein